jgi:phage-related tail protein
MHRAELEIVQAEKLEKRLELYVEGKVRAILHSEAVQAGLQKRLEDARRVMESEVDAALEAERAKAEAERQKKQEAIDEKRMELQRLEQQREEAVWLLTTSCLFVYFLFLFASS